VCEDFYEKYFHFRDWLKWPQQLGKWFRLSRVYSSLKLVLLGTEIAAIQDKKPKKGRKQHHEKKLVCDPMAVDGRFRIEEEV
jgi:hypothetical protein